MTLLLLPSVIIATDPVPSTSAQNVPYSVLQQLQIKFCDIPSFTHTDGSTTWLVFCGPVTTVNPTETPTSNPRVIIEHTTATTICHLEVHYQRIKSFPYEGIEQELSTLISSLQNDSNYVLCPGLPSSIASSVTFESKSLRKWGPLFQRLDHRKCLMWYPASRSSSKPAMCPKCSRLYHHLQDMIKRRKNISPTTRQKRTSAGSKYPKRYLTPKSRLEREKNERRQALANKRAAKKLHKFDINVNDMTNDDLIAVVAELEPTSKNALEKLLMEADLAGMIYTEYVQVRG